MSVNVAAQQMHRPSFPDDVRAAIAHAGISPKALVLELTETTLMDAQVRAHREAAARRSGSRLSIDDFGTGYSSMSYLKRFAVDEVKIDRSFITGLGTDPDDATIVGAIVNMTRTLGLVDDRRRRGDHRAARRAARVGLRARAGVPVRTRGARPSTSITCWRRRSPEPATSAGERSTSSGTSVQINTPSISPGTTTPASLSP